MHNKLCTITRETFESSMLEVWIFDDGHRARRI